MHIRVPFLTSDSLLPPSTATTLLNHACHSPPNLDATWFPELEDLEHTCVTGDLCKYTLRVCTLVARSNIVVTGFHLVSAAA